MVPNALFQAAELLVRSLQSAVLMHVVLSDRDLPAITDDKSGNGLSRFCFILFFGSFAYL